jgi:hypothetical protein
LTTKASVCAYYHPGSIICNLGPGAAALPGLIEVTAVELGRVFSPVVVALDSEEELALFLRRFGISFSADVLNGPVATLKPLSDGIRAIISAARSAADNGFKPADIAPLFESARPLFGSIANISSNLSGLVPSGMTPQALQESLAALPEELLDLLLADYLDTRAPLLLYLLNLLDVYRPEVIDASERGISYVRHNFDWSRLGQLFDNPENWARDAYGWGVDFDSDKLIWRMSRLIELIGGAVRIEDMSPAVQAVFLPNLPNPLAPPNMAFVPFIRKQAVADDGTLDTTATGEAGLTLFPVSGKPATDLTDRGLAAAPYLDGAAGVSADFGNGFEARVNGTLGAVGAIVFAVRPSGMEVSTGIDAIAFDGAFTLELTKQPVAGASVVTLVGQPGSSRVEAKSITAALGGEISSAGNDFFVSAGVKALKAVIDPSSDGFLGMLLSGPVEIDVGDVLAGWRAGRGIYFEGGSKLSVTVPINKTLGPVKLYKIGVGVDFSQPSLTGTITADAQIGPMYAFVDGLGLTVMLVQNEQGALGKHDLTFALKLPTGYAIALQASGIEGGGYLSIRDTEYRGALALKFETIGFSAFAILDTTLPNGQRGFSFVASIFGDFVLPLGDGFFLTGLGGIIGVNRTTSTQALRDALYAGSMDSLLFPTDPIANAETILNTMAAVFPPRDGQYVFGPVARIAFNQPALITGTLGIIIEVGGETRLFILGALRADLPTQDAALISLRLSFFGEVDFAAGTISFDATLQSSRILTYPVSGDIAVRSGWAPHIEQVVSFGGLHPQYPRPANLPDLRRLAINFGTDNPRITLTAYQAITLNSLQFGARGDLYAKGPKIPFVGRLAAEGNAYFDALIYFHPFAFDAALGGGLSLLVDDEVIVGLGFDLHLTGPNVFVIDGRVWATVFGIDVGFDVHHSWGDPSTLPDAIADAVAILTSALSDNATLESISSPAFADGVRFVDAPKSEPRRALTPAGGARFVERAMPLGVVIEKIGEATLVGPLNTFDLQVSAAGGVLSPRAAALDFVRGHFWSLSEGERLRAVAFESHKAGFEIAPGEIVIDAGAAIEDTYDYEIIVIGDDANVAPPIRAAALDATLLASWVSAGHRDRSAPLDTVAAFGTLRVDAIRINATEYVTVPVAGGAASASFDTFNAARLAAFGGSGPVSANPVVNRYVAVSG